MSEENKTPEEETRKNLSEEELGDVAGGVKSYNSSKSNTSFSVENKKKDDGKKPAK